MTADVGAISMTGGTTGVATSVRDADSGAVGDGVDIATGGATGDATSVVCGASLTTWGVLSTLGGAIAAVSVTDLDSGGSTTSCA